MPKYNIFQNPSLFSYVNKIHIRYNPGSFSDDNCRRLLLKLLNPNIHKKHPQLKYTYELLNYYERPEIFITVHPNHSFRFYADVNTLEDIQRAIDPYQYEAHVKYVKTRSLESKLDEDD